MFTGIVTDIGEVLAVTPSGNDLHRLRIACRYPHASIENGASIACAGICLTAVESGEERGQNWFEVDTAAETLRVTTAGRWRKGARLNLERSLKVGDELGGHFVLGHVDGIAEIVTREDLTDSARFALRAPKDLLPFIAAKGSVTLDGVSLTVNEAASDTFSVLIIPHTLQVTTFGGIKVGDPVNLEVDVMARYAARLLEVRQLRGLATKAPAQYLTRELDEFEMAEPRRSTSIPAGDLKGARVLIVEARFYDDIADALLNGATRVLEEAGASFDRVSVPGSLEIPAAIAMALDAKGQGGKHYDAAIGLGCVIRGDTIHFEIVSNESARGLMDLSVARAFPIGNGIITVDNEQQAWDRAKSDKLDKGGDAARAALAMLRLKRSFSGAAR